MSVKVEDTGQVVASGVTAKLMASVVPSCRSKVSLHTRVCAPVMASVAMVGSPMSAGWVEPATYVTPAGSTSVKDTLYCATAPPPDGFDAVSV